MERWVGRGTRLDVAVSDKRGELNQGPKVISPGKALALLERTLFHLGRWQRQPSALEGGFKISLPTPLQSLKR
jgi:hypothetical protein